MSIVLRTRAEEEVTGLLGDIRAANPRAADTVQDEIQRTFELLEANPLSGARCRVRNPNVRELRIATVRSYPQFVILYLPTATGIEVLHVVRGRRRLGRVVRDD